MQTQIADRNGEKYFFRKLNKEDGKGLGFFFESLSVETRSRFGPHPLNREHALLLCANAGKENADRFVVLDGENVIGYFILDFNNYEHEAARYRSYGIELNPEVDPVFAPCIADGYQNRGIARGAMEAVINYAHSRGLRSLVLMGGTQETNQPARAFYIKCGFAEYGTFYTDYNGLNNIDMMLKL